MPRAEVLRRLQASKRVFCILLEGLLATMLSGTDQASVSID
jgi:hypothetical protein